MSGGGGGTIIIGDKPIVEEVYENIIKVAAFRVKRFLDIRKRYSENENSVTRDDQQFVLRCAADVVDNA